MSQAWKSLERQIARAIGGQRNKRGGDFSQSLPDVESEALVIECKYRKSLPQWLKDALAQAKRYAHDERFPAVVLKERYQHGAIVVMSLDDFVDWFGKVICPLEDGG